MSSLLTLDDLDPWGKFSEMLPAPIRAALRHNDTKRFKKDFKGPTYQKGMLHPIGFWHAPASAGGTVNITNRTVSHTNLGAGGAAGIQFLTTGLLQEIGPGFITTTDVPGEWHTDEPAVTGSNFEVRCASISAGSWTIEAATTGTWIDVSADRLWRVSVAAKAAPSYQSCTAVMELGDVGTSSADDSATITCEYTN